MPVGRLSQLCGQVGVVGHREAGRGQIGGKGRRGQDGAGLAVEGLATGCGGEVGERGERATQGRR